VIASDGFLSGGAALLFLRLSADEVLGRENAPRAAPQPKRPDLPSGTRRPAPLVEPRAVLRHLLALRR
jgi:hypothetical protein